MLLYPLSGVGSSSKRSFGSVGGAPQLEPAVLVERRLRWREAMVGLAAVFRFSEELLLLLSSSLEGRRPKKAASPPPMPLVVDAPAGLYRFVRARWLR